MRAMSLGLVKVRLIVLNQARCSKLASQGLIDEVESAVQITWVQPRVLGTDQMEHMQKSLEEWSDKVKAAESFINDRTLELFS